MWFKMKHEKTPVMQAGLKTWKSMAFEVPERLRETLVPSSIAPDAALAMAHPPEEEFVDPIDWETDIYIGYVGVL